ncbi:hypothetical protein ACM66B_000702 [Microbotryomycetes sp. NB124-2]
MLSSLASFVATLALVGVLAPEHVVAQSSAGTALPPSASSLPGCAITCTLTSLPGTPCAQYGVSNTTCICTDQQFQLAFYECQSRTCSQSELQAALQFGAQTCSANGTPINTSVAPSGFSSSAVGSATASGSSAAASSASRSSAASSGASSASRASSASSAPAASNSAPASSAATGATPAASSAAPTSPAGKLEFNVASSLAVALTGAALVGGVRILF